MLVVTAVAVGLFGVPLALGVRRLYYNEAVVKLEREAAEAGIAVPASFASTADPVELPDPGGRTHLALYGSDGVRVAGQGPARADDEVAAALRGDVRDGRAPGTLVVAVPLASEERVFAAIRASVARTEVDGRVRRAWLAMAALAAGALAAAGGLAWRQARRLSRPVRALAAAATQLGHGDFSIRAEPSGVAEVDAAGGALNVTAARLGDLLARERAFSADASHQLRTPLTRLRLRLESALAAPEPARLGLGVDGIPRDPAVVPIDGPPSREGGASEAIRAALADIGRLEATVDELLTLARDMAPASEQLDLAPVLSDVERRWHGPLAAEGRPLRVVADQGLPPVHVSAVALRHGLDVLVANAAEHGAGTVTVQARAAAGGLAIDVSDEGPGPPAGADLFRRRSVTASGRGIGLAMARSLIEAEGGRLVLSRSGPEPCFTVLLPEASGEPAEG